MLRSSEHAEPSSPADGIAFVRYVKARVALHRGAGRRVGAVRFAEGELDARALVGGTDVAWRAAPGGYVEHFFAPDQPRDESGQWSGGGGSRLATQLAPEARPKRAPPGSQLPPEHLARAKALGITKLPAADVPADQVEVDFDLAGLHERAVLRWRDGSGKVQASYTPEFHEAHAAKKWAKIEELLPHIDEMRDRIVDRVRETEPGSPEHLAATAAGVIAVTGLRPGNADSVAHGKFGIATLRKEHVAFEGDDARLDFIGKAGKRNLAVVTEPALVGALREAHGAAAEGGPLFPVPLERVRAAAPTGVRLKDFRTALATQTARATLALIKPPPPLAANDRAARKQLASALRTASTRVAQTINNTPAVARAAYIHPKVFSEWLGKVGGARARALAGV